MPHRFLLLALAVCASGCVGGKGVDPKNDPDEVVIAADADAATHKGVFAKNKSRLPKPPKPLEIIPLAKRLTALGEKSLLFRTLAKAPFNGKIEDTEKAFGKPDSVRNETRGFDKGLAFLQYEHLVPNYRIEVGFYKDKPLFSLKAQLLSPGAFTPRPSLMCQGDTDCLDIAMNLPMSEVELDTKFGDPSEYTIRGSTTLISWRYRDPQKPFEEIRCLIDSDGLCRTKRYYDFYKQMALSAKRHPELQKEFDQDVKKYQSGESWSSD